jgi:F0F1-type ATP synthase assembly protein I
MPIVIKYLITAALVVLISEVAKRSDNLGALIASLPIVTFLVLIWLHLENASSLKISNHAYYTFWYVVPTLPMFLVFPYLYNQFGFWPAMGACVLLTFGLFIAWALLVKQFGISLL